MKLTFRKHEVKSLKRLEDLVTEHAEAIEPGCRIVAAGINLGRATVDLVGVDARRTPLLVALGFTADDEMLFRMLEAYAWCLEYPESLRRLVGDERGGWPPRVVVVAERVREAFLRKLRLLKFPAADCFEFRCVEVNGSTGFYLDAVDTSRGGSTLHEADASAPPTEAPRVVAPVVTRAPERSGAPEGREDGPEQRERVTVPAAGQSGAGVREEPPRWLELLTTPVELAAILPAAAPGVPVEPARRPPAEIGRDESAGENGQKPGGPLDGVDLGQSRELAPTWRKFLERLTAGFDAVPPSPVEDLGPEKAPSGDRDGGEPVAFAPGARPERNGGGDKRGLPEGIQLPANGELAPQWRKFLDRPSIDEGKIAAVKEYLHREFPLCTIYEFFEFQRNAQVFQLQDSQGKVSQITTITAEFFEGRREAEIRPWLEKHRLAHAMRQAGQAGVLVNAAGLHAEKR